MSEARLKMNVFSNFSVRPEVLLSAALHDRWEMFLKQLKRCRKKCSERSVHDMRVATRRLIAAIDLLATISADSTVQKTRQSLKRVLKLMGPLRDTQVQLLQVEKMLPQFPELEPFCTVLLLRERRQLKQIERKLERVQSRTLRESVAATIEQLDVRLGNPAMSVAAGLALQGAMAAAFARTIDLQQRVDPADTETIHKLRIAFKKFRYVNEILDRRPDELLRKAMNAYQVKMGDIHDIEILSATVSAYATKRSKRPIEMLLPVQQHLRRRHTEHVEAFVSTVDDLHRFYSPSFADLELSRHFAS